MEREIFAFLSTGLQPSLTLKGHTLITLAHGICPRRLREIARQVIPETARADYDYVLVGRQGALGRDFLAMRAELHEALRRLKALAAPTSVVAPAPTPVAATTATPHGRCAPRPGRTSTS